MKLADFRGTATQKFYVTFGFGQPHKGKYHIIEAVSRDAAHDQAMRTFNGIFGMLYDEKQWHGDEEGEDGEPQNELYNLTLLP